MLDINRLDELKYAMELGATIPFDNSLECFELYMFEDEYALTPSTTCSSSQSYVRTSDWEEFKAGVIKFLLEAADES